MQPYNRHFKITLWMEDGLSRDSHSLSRRNLAPKMCITVSIICQIFYSYTVDLYKLKFFDESGIELPDVGKPNYGHSLKGTPAVEISRNMN